MIDSQAIGHEPDGLFLLRKATSIAVLLVGSKMGT